MVSPQWGKPEAGGQGHSISVPRSTSHGSAPALCFLLARRLRCLTGAYQSKPNSTLSNAVGKPSALPRSLVGRNLMGAESSYPIDGGPINESSGKERQFGAREYANVFPQT